MSRVEDDYSAEELGELRASSTYGTYLQVHGPVTEETEHFALEYAERVLGMKCARCDHRTGNNNQGHYWAFCKITGGKREHHFCCPGDCELEAPAYDRFRARLDTSIAKDPLVTGGVETAPGIWELTLVDGTPVTLTVAEGNMITDTRTKETS